jgi:hypothetical protein
VTTISSEPATTGVSATSSLEGVSGDDQAMRAWAEALVARARRPGRPGGWLSTGWPGRTAQHLSSVMAGCP